MKSWNMGWNLILPVTHYQGQKKKGRVPTWTALWDKNAWAPPSLRMESSGLHRRTLTQTSALSTVHSGARETRPRLCPKSPK